MNKKFVNKLALPNSGRPKRHKGGPSEPVRGSLKPLFVTKNHWFSKFMCLEGAWLQCFSIRKSLQVA